jgi:hypothetical protein
MLTSCVSVCLHFLCPRPICDLGVTVRITGRQANPVTSVKLVSNDNQECDTSAKTIKSNS